MMLIPAPAGLHATFKNKDGFGVTCEPVYAFGNDGDAMVLSESDGRLVPVYSVSEPDMEFMYLEFLPTNMYHRRGGPTVEMIKAQMSKAGHPKVSWDNDQAADVLGNREGL